MKTVLLVTVLLCAGCQNVSFMLFVENDLGNGTRSHAEVAWHDNDATGHTYSR